MDHPVPALPSSARRGRDPAGPPRHTPGLRVPVLRLVLLALLPLTASAQAPTAAEPAPGRLFHTPAQRAELDRARDRPPAESARPRASPPPAPATLSVEGVVRRDDGQSTVWINRQPTRAPADTGGVRIGPVRDAAGEVELRVPESGRRLRVKVGQEADPASGEVRDHYRRPQSSAGVDPTSAAASPSEQPPGAPARRTVREGEPAEEASRARARLPAQRAAP